MAVASQKLAHIAWVWMAVAGIIGLLVALWFMFVDAPAPERLCQHKLDMLQQSVGDHALAAQARWRAQIARDCVRNEEQYIRLRGRIKYAERAKCVMSARTPDEMERC